MNSLEFRSELLQHVRAFETWAWKDSRESPEDYADMTTFDSWFQMFYQYLQGEAT